jgi:hypothetical protein
MVGDLGKINSSQGFPWRRGAPERRISGKLNPKSKIRNKKAAGTAYPGGGL